MFDQVLNETRGDLAGNDLGHIIIQHEGLHNTIIIPLQPWDDINADVVMGTTIGKVLNSNQNLTVDEIFDWFGGLTQREWWNSSMNPKNQRKKIIAVENLWCDYRKMMISYVWREQQGSAGRNWNWWEQWTEITKQRQKESNVQLILEQTERRTTTVSDSH